MKSHHNTSVSSKSKKSTTSHILTSVEALFPRSNIPESVDLKILALLDPQSLIVYARISRYWKRQTENTQLWATICSENKCEVKENESLKTAFKKKMEMPVSVNCKFVPSFQFSSVKKLKEQYLETLPKKQRESIRSVRLRCNGMWMEDHKKVTKYPIYETTTLIAVPTYKSKPEERKCILM